MLARNIKASLSGWYAVCMFFVLIPQHQALGLSRLSRHFRFEFQKDAQGTALMLAKNAESDRNYVVTFLGIRGQEMVVVRVVATNTEMSRALGTNSMVEPWIAGLAIPDRNLVIISTRGNEVFSAREVFLHELGHIYLHKAVGNHHVPRWFDEGFAMYVSGEPILRRLKTMLPAAALDNLFPLKQLDKSFPSGPPGVHVAYAESMMFVRYLFNRYGHGAMIALVNELHKGIPFAQAFKLTFGVDLQRVEKGFRQSFSSTPYLLITLTGSGVLWLLIALILGWVYLRRREQDREKIRQWEDENALMLASYLSKLSKKQEPPQA